MLSVASTDGCGYRLIKQGFSSEIQVLAKPPLLVLSFDNCLKVYQDPYN